MNLIGFRSLYISGEIHTIHLLSPHRHFVYKCSHRSRRATLTHETFGIECSMYMYAFLYYDLCDSNGLHHYYTTSQKELNNLQNNSFLKEELL